jgi:hypothetical protein
MDARSMSTEREANNRRWLRILKIEKRVERLRAIRKAIP